MSDWTGREGNSNIEEKLLIAYLIQSGYTQAQINIAINYDDAYDEVIKKARDAGIPVIVLNTDDSQGAQGTARMAFIGQDLQTAGSLIARRLVQGGNLKAGDKVVCPVEHPDAVYAHERYTGAKKVFDEVGIESEVLNSSIKACCY